MAAAETEESLAAWLTEERLSRFTCNGRHVTRKVPALFGTWHNKLRPRASEHWRAPNKASRDRASPKDAHLPCHGFRTTGHVGQPFLLEFLFYLPSPSSSSSLDNSSERAPSMHPTRSTPLPGLLPPLGICNWTFRRPLLGPLARLFPHGTTSPMSPAK